MAPVVEPRLTVAEVAALTHRSEEYIRSEMRSGRLRSYLPHGRKRGRLVRMDWLREWEERASDRHDDGRVEESGCGARKGF